MSLQKFLYRVHSFIFKWGWTLSYPLTFSVLPVCICSVVVSFGSSGSSAFGGTAFFSSITDAGVAASDSGPSSQVFSYVPVSGEILKNCLSKSRVLSFDADDVWSMPMLKQIVNSYSMPSLCMGSIPTLTTSDLPPFCCKAYAIF